MNLVEERDLHLVVIDNASTDETHSLKAKYEERGVNWIWPVAPLWRSADDSQLYL
jgi:glycosyltransferase involved in cell wall biosynthesis